MDHDDLKIRFRMSIRVIMFWVTPWAAVTPKRLFRFSLRTLFVLLTVAAAGMGWVSWQGSIVEERRRMIEEIGRLDTTVMNDPNQVLFGCPDDAWMDAVRADIPWTWRLLGAQAVFKIALDTADYSQADARRISGLFPEAWIELNSAKTNITSTGPVSYRALHQAEPAYLLWPIEAAGIRLIMYCLFVTGGLWLWRRIRRAPARLNFDSTQ